MDIASFDLEGNADAVEFCPYPAFHELLAAATYTLQQDGNELTRSGSISLFSATTTGLKLLHRIHTPGVFDIKWNPGIKESGSLNNSIDDHPLLVLAGADGFLNLYSLHSIELTLSEFCKEELSSSSMCLCVDWSSSGSSISAGLSNGWVSTIALREDRLQNSRSWAAHEYETWAVLFDARKPDQLLYTGSDDCCFSGWDLRQSSASAVF